MNDKVYVIYSRYLTPLAAYDSLDKCETHFGGPGSVGISSDNVFNTSFIVDNNDGFVATIELYFNSKPTCYIVKDFHGWISPYNSLAMAFRHHKLMVWNKYQDFCVQHSSVNQWQIDSEFSAFSIYKLKVQ